jgi:hypothetical protein
MRYNIRNYAGGVPSLRQPLRPFDYGDAARNRANSTT